MDATFVGPRMFGCSSRAGCLACVTLIFLQDMRSHQALSALAALVAVSHCCFGQAGKAEVFGSIQDPHGLAVSQARVSTQEQATGSRFDVVPDEPRAYLLPGSAPVQ